MTTITPFCQPVVLKLEHVEQSLVGWLQGRLLPPDPTLSFCFRRPVVKPESLPSYPVPRWLGPSGYWSGNHP